MTSIIGLVLWHWHQLTAIYSVVWCRMLFNYEFQPFTWLHHAFSILLSLSLTLPPLSYSLSPTLLQWDKNIIVTYEIFLLYYTYSWTKDLQNIWIVSLNFTHCLTTYNRTVVQVAAHWRVTLTSWGPFISTAPLLIISLCQTSSGIRIPGPKLPTLSFVSALLKFQSRYNIITIILYLCWL